MKPNIQTAKQYIEVQFGCLESDALQMSDVPDETCFERWVLAVLSKAGVAGAICLRVIGGEEMLQLNTQYRGKNATTNVLSFPADVEIEGEASVLGDIAICAEVVVAEALAQKKPTVNHWAHMTVHGVLHLLGYDHQNDSEAERMEALEIEILSSLKIPDPYNV